MMTQAQADELKASAERLALAVGYAGAGCHAFATQRPELPADLGLGCHVHLPMVALGWRT